MQRTSQLLLLFGALLSATGQSPAQAPVGSAFTYQGRLTDGGSTANGTYDIRFHLFDASTNGAVLDTTCAENVEVVDGLFTASLDFGGLFDGNERWIEVEVRLDGGALCGNGSGYTVLSPRQPVTAAPYALFALNGGGGGHWVLNGNNIYNANTGNVGMGTTAPAAKLHVAGNLASMRLQDDDNLASYAVIEDVHPTQVRMNKFTNTGVSAIDFNPMPLDNASTSMVRFFRETNSLGPKEVRFHRGNNTSSVSALVGVDGGNSFFQAHGGDLGIGTQSPSAKLDVRGDVKLGAGGEYFAAAGEENLRIVRGTVDGDGSILQGSGFYVTHSNDSWYFIHFVPPFSGVPSVTATTEWVGENPRYAVVESNPDPDEVAIGAQLEEDVFGIGLLVNSDFSFIAIGPR